MSRSSRIAGGNRCTGNNSDLIAVTNNIDEVELDVEESKVNLWQFVLLVVPVNLALLNFVVFLTPGSSVHAWVLILTQNYCKLFPISILW